METSTIGEGNRRGQVFALAGTNVQKLVRIAPSDLVSVAGREMLSLGGTPLPVAALAGVLGLAARERAAPAGRTLAVIVAAGDKHMVFVVDEFLAEQEIVIKNLGGAHPACAPALGGDGSALGTDRPGVERGQPARRSGHHDRHRRQRREPGQRLRQAPAPPPHPTSAAYGEDGND